MTTPTDRGDLAERMLPVAARLACIVHGDGAHQDIAHVLDQLDRSELIAVIVDLAAMVNPDTRIDDALSHITYDEHGKPAPALANGKRTLRGLAKDLSGPLLGIDMVLESERRLRARHLYLHDRLSVAAVAQEIGASTVTVDQWITQGGWRQAPTITTTDARTRRTTTSRSAA